MSHLNTKANIAKPDEFYHDLLVLHEGRSEKESEALNAKLVLILANHIGDAGVLREAMDWLPTHREEARLNRLG